MLTKPSNPKIIKIILDKISTNFGFNLLPKNLPKNRAIELLATIPKIEPRINEILYLGYWTPSPKEARNVLSPNSPITILRAIIAI